MNLGGYEFTLKLDNKFDLGLNPLFFSFSIRDSIYKSLPELIVSLRDNNGLLQEYLVFLEGRFLNLEFGINENYIRNEYVISQCENVGVKRKSYISGDLCIKAIHSLDSIQTLKSAAYKGTASSVVLSLINNSKYNFKKINIDDTIGVRVWYQGLRTDIDFIENVLLPNSVKSGTEGKTPYYFFITNDNDFNFVSYNTLINKKPVAEFDVAKIVNEGDRSNVIIDLKKYGRMNQQDIKDFKKRLIFKQDKRSSKYIFENDAIEDYKPTYLGRDKIFLPFKKEEGKLFSIYNDHYDEEDIDLKYLKNSRRAFFQRGDYEYLIFTTNFNPNLKSGETITIRMNVMEDNGDLEISNYYTGNYLIETCVHTWNPNNKILFTELKVTRKYINLPSNYVIRNMLISK